MKLRRARAICFSLPDKGTPAPRPSETAAAVTASATANVTERLTLEDNRVALALYGGQVGIDASVVELVPMGATRTEPIGSLATSAVDSRSVRTAGSGHQPSLALSRHEPPIREPLELETETTDPDHDEGPAS